MTKIQLDFDLARPLDDTLMDRISRAHGVYGIHRIVVAPTLDAITVEFDATHLAEYEVEGVLFQNGIPAKLRRSIASPAQG